MQQSDQALEDFIFHFARKIDVSYRNNCADTEDYIQAGHLKLAEIRADGHDKKNFVAYAVVSVARAMRNFALGAMCIASAPHRVKRQIHRIEMLLDSGNTEQEICEQLHITRHKFAGLRSMLCPQSWQTLFAEPTNSLDPFSVLTDILSSANLTKEDKEFIVLQIDGQTNKLGLTRKQRWLRTKSLRPKLTRSGYAV